jgi:hypothetical protein
MKVTDLRRKLMATLAACGMVAPGALYAADLNVNLLTNPNFENVSFATTGNYGAPMILDWLGGPGFAYSHDGSGGVPDYANGGPLAGGGSYYFTPGRPGADIIAPGEFYQDINVSTGASGTLIATGNAAYRVGAFFSSYLAQGDFGNVHLDFRDSASNSLGSVVISDNDTSTWSQNFRGGSIPAGTHTVRVSLFGTPLAGSPDGYMDNVEFLVSDQVIQPVLAITVNRDTGGISLSNQTGSAVNLSGYSITSGFEGLAPANWLSIADNYDAGSPGPNQFDAAHHWSELTNPNAHGDLSEGDLDAGTGASLVHNRTINLGSTNAWIRNPTEDLLFQYISDGQVVQGIVTYVGNGGQPFTRGDFNLDGSISAADWAIFRANQHADLSGQSLAEAYRLGDLNGDRRNDHADFRAFKTLYDDSNGAGSFAALLTGVVPEPGTAMLLITSGMLVLPNIRRRSTSDSLYA